MAPVFKQSVKFDANIFSIDRYMAILLLRWFGCKVPIPAHFGEVFWGFDFLNVGECCSNHERTHPWPESRVLLYRSSRSVKKCDVGARWKMQKKKKERDVTSHTFAQTTHVTLHPPKLSCGVGPKHSQPCQVSSKWVKLFRLPEGSKSAFFLYLVLYRPTCDTRNTNVQCFQ